MTSLETGILVSYFFILSILAVYGWHRYYLVYEYMKHRDRVPGPMPLPAELPNRVVSRLHRGTAQRTGGRIRAVLLNGACQERQSMISSSAMYRLRSSCGENSSKLSQKAGDPRPAWD